MNFLTKAFFVLLTIPTIVFGAPDQSEPREKSPIDLALPHLSPAAVGSLKHAEKLVTAIKARDLKALNLQPYQIPPFLASAVENKDWVGIGAYLKTTYQADRTLTHAFRIGAPDSPHEIWFRYKIDGDKFSFDRIEILGW